MGAIEHLTIALPAEMVARLRDRVRSGEFADESAAIADALAEIEALHAVDATLPAIGEDRIDHWLKTEVAGIFDRMKRDPARRIPLHDVTTALDAERAARGM